MCGKKLTNIKMLTFLNTISLYVKTAFIRVNPSCIFKILKEPNCSLFLNPTSQFQGYLNSKE